VLADSPTDESVSGAPDVKILVVDQEQSQRVRLATALQSLGLFAIQEATSQPEALLLAASNPIDLIIYSLEVAPEGLRFSGDTADLGEFVSYVLTGPLSPAMVEAVTEHGRTAGIPWLDPAERASLGNSHSGTLRQRSFEVAASSRTLTISHVDLMQGLQKGEFQLYYQPILAVENGALIAADAMLRWRHRSYGLLLPSIFMDGLEPFVNEVLVNYAFEQFLMTLQKFSNLGLRLGFYVNFSELFLCQPGAANQLLQLCEDYPEIEPSMITFDIPESAMLSPNPALLGNLARLRSKGFGLALDSYAALTTDAQISVVPFSFLKLNRAHLMTTDHKDRLPTIIQASQELAQEKGIIVCAQGVARSEEWNLVGSIGCKLAQGDLISGPLTDEDFFAWAQAHTGAIATPVAVEPPRERTSPGPRPVRARAKPPRSGPSSRIASEPTRDADVLSLTAMLSILVNSGASFGAIFQLLQDCHQNWLQPVLQDLEMVVTRDREPLSQALRRHPEVFSDPYVAMVELGESNDLGKFLGRLYAQLAQDMKRKQDPLFDCPPALSAACRNVADILEGGGQTATSLASVARTCGNERVQKGFLRLSEQVKQGKRLTECDFPSVFPPIFAVLVTAHEGIGSVPAAFSEFADLLETTTG
jgi:EAL domain-containing protein (putative c-di-GMP-specific phosphodiesterase class I)